MSIASVELPPSESSDSDSSSDLAPPPKRAKAPVRTEIRQESDSDDDNPFELKQDSESQKIKGNISYEQLGLPPLTFTSDPFLSPIKNVQFSVKRDRIWIKGIKGVKFTLTLAGQTVLVAKRKMKYMKKTWFISRSLDFAIDTPSLVCILVKQRSGVSFTFIGPNERQEDHYRLILGGIQFNGSSKKVVIGKDLWAPPEDDDIFSQSLTPDNSYHLENVSTQFDIKSVKNCALSLEGQLEPVIKISKQFDGAVIVDAREPLSLAQAFAITIAHFMQ